MSAIGSRHGSELHSSKIAQSDGAQASASDLPIETLIDHLVNAKKALTSLDTLYRANEIVATAQTALEESVLLSAQTGFLRRAITHQVRVVDRVRLGLDQEVKNAEDDFQTVVQNLDTADARLKATMETLRSTIVHSALRPSNEAPRSLLDFIDESSFDTLHSTIESTLDSASTTHRTFKASQDAFTAECEVLLTYIKAAAPPISKRGENPIPSLLGELHTHAEQMAHLLMSLNSHYDLCADAVRHTEGGFLALQNAKTGNRIPDGVSVSNVLPSPDSSTKIAPLSSEERRQMLAVIDADAAELPDVIADLNARLSEMEVVLPGILAFVSKQRATYKSITSTFRALLTIGKRLPTYISASTIFHTHWCPLLTTLSSQVSELDQVRDFYIGYLSSYDQLILEAARRRNREEKIKEVLQSALEKVEKMRKRDTKERERFRREVGDFLPADLWGGLRRDAPVWEVVVYGDGFEGENEEGEGKLDKAEEDVGMSTPSLPGEIVDAARRREADRGLGLVI